jgi:hypothetical protein
MDLVYSRNFTAAARRFGVVHAGGRKWWECTIAQFGGLPSTRALVVRGEDGFFVHRLFDLGDGAVEMSDRLLDLSATRGLWVHEEKAARDAGRKSKNQNAERGSSGPTRIRKIAPTAGTTLATQSGKESHRRGWPPWRVNRRVSRLKLATGSVRCPGGSQPPAVVATVTQLSAFCNRVVHPREGGYRSVARLYGRECKPDAAKSLREDSCGIRAGVI